MAFQLNERVLVPQCSKWGCIVGIKDYTSDAGLCVTWYHVVFDPPSIVWSRGPFARSRYSSGTVVYITMEV